MLNASLLDRSEPGLPHEHSDGYECYRELTVTGNNKHIPKTHLCLLCGEEDGRGWKRVVELVDCKRMKEIGREWKGVEEQKRAKDSER